MNDNPNERLIDDLSSEYEGLSHPVGNDIRFRTGAQGVGFGCRSTPINPNVKKNESIDVKTSNCYGLIRQT